MGVSAPKGWVIRQNANRKGGVPFHWRPFSLGPLPTVRFCMGVGEKRIGCCPSDARINSMLLDRGPISDGPRKPEPRTINTTTWVEKRSS